MQNQSRLVSEHRQKLKKLDELFSMRPWLSPNYHAHDINPAQGYGSSDLYDFERICLGRGNFCFNEDKQLHCEMPFHSLGITIFLSGKHYFVHQKTGKKYVVDPPQIVLRKGKFGLVDFHLPAHTPVSMLSIDFNTELLDKINSSVSKNRITRFFLNSDVSDILIMDKLDPKLICTSQYLLGMSKANNELDLINIEGLALSLLGSLFKLPSEQDDKYWKEIKKAISILESQFSEKITIPKLARQVGINECYLKRYFKHYTGLTISSFLEKYRMELALILFSQGKAAHEIAYKIGYDNFYYFKSVFRKHFGYFPEN